MTNETKPESIYQAATDRAGQEAERLHAMAATFDHHSAPFLSTLGVAKGSKVLELGPGIGTITQLWMDLVGETGEVTVIDVATDMVEPHGPNLRKVSADLNSAHLGESDYDVVWTRSTLGLLAQRSAVIGRAARALKPGGSLVIETVDFGVASKCGGKLGQVWSGMIEGGELVNVETDWQAGLASVVEETGLEVVSLSHHASYCRSSSADLEHWVRTLRLAEEFLEPGVIPKGTINDAIDYISSTRSWQLMPGLTRVHARSARGAF